MKTIAALVLLLCSAWAAAIEFTPAATNDDIDNPHKGYMLWGTTWAQGGADNYYGASIYHVYVPWRELETADQVFDWAGFEQRHLQPILADDPKATFVLRPVADYPDSVGTGLSFYYTGGQPERDYPLFLEQPPLNIAGFDYVSCNGDGPGRTPDWNAAAFATQAVQLVQALAQRYDADPRVTAIQVGLLGLWGEWHQSGCDANGPGNAIKIAVRDAYQQAFSTARLQTRYARNPDVVGTDFAFHEDYFPSFTANCIYGFPLCDVSGDWSLEYGLANIVPAARQNWRRNPVSGESPLASQQDTWTSDTDDVITVLNNYHFSFLGPAGKHAQPGFAAPLARIKRALGYDFSVNRFVLGDPITQGTSLPWRLELANRGSAPAYHATQVRLELLDAGNAVRATTPLAVTLDTAEPGTSSTWRGRLHWSGLAAGSYTLRLVVADAVAGRPGIVLQNMPRDAAAAGVRLGSITLAAVVGDRIHADSFSLF
ncbi:MAG: DUF4832 domain-containing protein [Rhodanobacteraceae bacterium]|nr:DUF4832 domain-containing protein [Rhodanobacteraceae bacterium]